MGQQQVGTPEPLWRLFYRYLWPFQYFRDVSRGSRLERQLNYRHNRAMRGCLPAFALKWVMLALLAYGAGRLAERNFDLVLPATCCYLGVTAAAVILVQITLAWAWLERFPERYE